MDIDNDKLDEALEETFPASDPPANTPETGLGTPPALADPPDRPTPEKFSSLVRPDRNKPPSDSD